jgi:hypothetical protein
VTKPNSFREKNNMSLVSGHTRQHTFATEYDATLAYNEIHFNGKSVTLIGPSDEARAEGTGTFGDKNISFLGGFALNLNNITGPGSFTCLSPRCHIKNGLSISLSILIDLKLNFVSISNGRGASHGEHSCDLSASRLVAVRQLAPQNAVCNVGSATTHVSPLCPPHNTSPAALR